MLFFLIDKIKAMGAAWKMRELNLLLCCLNAPIASLLSMQIFRHKTLHPHFYLVSAISLYINLRKFGDIFDSCWIKLGYLNFIMIVVSLLLRV